MLPLAQFNPFRRANPRSALHHLSLIFNLGEGAVREHLKRTPVSPLRLFQTEHLPLLVSHPLFSLLSPFRWWNGIGIAELFGAMVVPVIAVFIFLLPAAAFDRLLEHRRGPHIADAEERRIKNVSLYLHLPVSGAGIFFLLHPMIGYLMILIAGLYSIYLSIRAAVELHGLIPATALRYYIQGLILCMVPVVLFALLFNLYTTTVILIDLF